MNWAGVADRLAVWLRGVRVAEITSRRPGQVVCRYAPEAHDRWPGGTPLLSCSLPLTDQPHPAAGTWFRGLLPEGQALQAMAAAAKVASYDTFGMLRRFGRDVAGAAMITAGDAEPRPGGEVPYSTEDLAAEVEGLEDRPLALHDDSELSLPGLQNKLLLISHDGGWARPTGGRASTHILKAEDHRYPGLVACEAGALRLARAVGLTSVDAEVVAIGTTPCLIVSRYDRIEGRAGEVERIHQEDLCQATGTDHEAARGRGKYEAHGGPGFRHAAALLDRYAPNPLEELERLVQIVTFTVAIGNADAHGKNISLLHDAGGTVRLAPLYDTVPTVLWERLPTRAAMHVGGCTDITGVTWADILAEARSWSLDEGRVAAAIRTTLEGLLGAVADGGIPDDLARWVARRADALMAGS